MHTPERIPDRTAHKADTKPHRTADSLRGKPVNKNYSAQRCCNSFLKTTFQSTIPSFIIKDCGYGTCNIITQENYEFLRDSYSRYAGLLNVKTAHTPGRTLNESISQLYYDMETILPDNIGVNFELYGGRLHFTLWKCHQWGNCRLYYFPVKFLNKINTDLRRISISFLHQLMHANRFGSIMDCDEHECIIECVHADYSSEDEGGEYIRNRRRIEAYQTGFIHKLMKRIERKSYHDNLYDALCGYNATGKPESDLVTAMLDGLDFLNPVKPIMHYAYDPFYEEEPDIRPIDLERQICLVYDDDDIVTNTLVDFINSDYQESYELIPVSTLKLTPQTESLFRVTDDYPERFFRWADKFIDVIKSIE